MRLIFFFFFFFSKKDRASFQLFKKGQGAAPCKSGLGRSENTEGSSEIPAYLKNDPFISNVSNTHPRLRALDLSVKRPNYFCAQSALLLCMITSL